MSSRQFTQLARSADELGYVVIAVSETPASVIDPTGDSYGVATLYRPEDGDTRAGVTFHASAHNAVVVMRECANRI